jgi:biopolymer transport protein ExbB/TolQ
MTYLVAIGILVIIIIAALITFNIKAASPQDENESSNALAPMTDRDPEEKKERGILENKDVVQQNTDHMSDQFYRQALKEIQPSQSETEDAHPNEAEKLSNEMNDKLYRNVLKGFSEKK